MVVTSREKVPQSIISLIHSKIVGNSFPAIIILCVAFMTMKDRKFHHYALLMSRSFLLMNVLKYVSIKHH